MATLEEARKLYIAARLHHDVCASAAKRARKQLKECEEALVETLLDGEMTQVKMESGLTLFLRKQFKISLSEETKPKVREWLLETTGDDKPFVFEDVDKKAVEEHCKTLDKDEIPEMLNLYTRPVIGVRNWDLAKIGVDE
jgi:hypothetical protein